MPFGKGSPSPVPPSPRKLLFWSVQGNLRAVSLPSATVSGGAAAPVRRPYPGIPERMGPLAWLHCRSCCDEILMLAGIVLRAWVLPEGEGVLWNLSLGQEPQLMRGLVCRRRAGQRHAVLLEEMRGGAAVSGREGKARLLVACTLFLQGHGWRSVCRARECPEGLKKIFCRCPGWELAGNVS